MSSNNNNNSTNSKTPKTPKQQYQESLAKWSSGDTVIPSGTIYYAVGTLVFCILFNLLYATGFISFVNDGFDIVLSTIGILLPLTAVFQLIIQLKGD